MPTKVVVDSRGRITLPSEIRRRLKIRNGTELTVELGDNNTIILRIERRITAKDLLGLAGEEKIDLKEIEETLAYTS